MVPSIRTEIHEEDVVPLVPTAAPPNDTLGISGAKSRFRHRAVLAVTVTLVSLVAALLLALKQGGVSGAADVIRKPFSSMGSSSSSTGPSCPRLCDARLQQRNEHFGGNLLDASYLKRAVTKARGRMKARLKIEYGEYYKQMFEPNGVSMGRLGVLSADKDSGVSVARFKRKLMMKILQVQTAILQAEEDVSGCDCTAAIPDQRRRQLQEGTIRATDDMFDSLPPLSDYYARMVWATGGHSAAAGHGNLHNESYTAFMEHAVKDIFASVGIDFEGRNYAMGGTPGAPEIALCSEAIFGTDADVISWDFGMMENDYYWKMSMYLNRAGINLNRPALAGIHLSQDGGRYWRERVAELRKLEDRGLIGLYVDYAQINSMLEVVPDMFGKNQNQIDSTPEYVRYYKCNGEIEHGDPGCSDEKYSNFICKDRKHKAGWHPGWREHALHGHVLGLFLADTLVDAVTAIGSAGSPLQFLSKLRAEEEGDYKKFFRSKLPDPVDLQDEGEWATAVNMTVLFRSPSICRTGRLPAQTRYLGILTEGEQGSSDHYDAGIPREQADNEVPADNDGVLPLPLVFDDGEHKQDCSVPTYIDYKDYFFNRNGGGWRSLTIPNEAERKEYVRDGWKPAGIFVVCFAGCDWGRCEDGELRHDGVYTGMLKMEVNHQKVLNVTKWTDDCAILHGEQGYHWKPTKSGQFELRIRLIDSKKKLFTKISSVVVL